MVGRMPQFNKVQSEFAGVRRHRSRPESRTRSQVELTERVSLFVNYSSLRKSKRGCPQSDRSHPVQSGDLLNK